MIALKNVTKKYKIRGTDYTWKNQLNETFGLEKPKYLTALNKVSFEVKKGEIFGILGPNGAGKTTMIKIIAGLLIPDGGECTVNGFDIIKDREKVRTSVNILLSSGWVIFDYKLTVAYNLKFWGVVQGLSLKEVDEKVDSVLKIVGLDDKRNDFPENLSAGLRQKMNLARCLLADRPIYLLDEPTASVDPYSANTIREFIKNTLKKEGNTIILATHNLWEAEMLCDRIAILHKGNILALGRTEDIKKKLGREMVVIEVGRVSEELVKRISALIWVDEVVPAENKLEVYGSVKRNLPEILDQCKGLTTIENVEIRELSLNEAFMRLIEKEGGT